MNSRRVAKTFNLILHMQGLEICGDGSTLAGNSLNPDNFEAALRSTKEMLG